jgi:hypothetical protein
MNVKEDRHHLNRIPTADTDTDTIPADLFIAQIRFLGTTTASKRRTPPHTTSMTPDARGVCDARSGGSIPIIPRDRKVANLRQRGGAPTLKLARGPVTPQTARGRLCPLRRKDVVVVVLWFRGTTGFPMVFRGKRPFALFLPPSPCRSIGECDYLLLLAGGGFVGVSPVGDAEMARVVWHVSGFFVVSWTGLWRGLIFSMDFTRDEEDDGRVYGYLYQGMKVSGMKN